MTRWLSYNVIFFLTLLSFTLGNTDLKAQTVPVDTLQKDPQKVIETIFATAQKGNPLENKESIALLDELFNYNQLAQNILGKGIPNLKAQDVAWFQKTIREIITKTVYPKSTDFLKNVKITYRKTQQDGNKAKVASVVQSKGEETDVVYILEKTNEERWRVVDVSIDDESWVKTINEKMMKSYKEKGWKGVKDLLNKRLSELQKTK